MAQKARANYLEKLLEDNINAAVAFGTYILGLASIVNTQTLRHSRVLPLFIFTFTGLFLQTVGQLLEPATSFPFNTAGYLISDIGYTYELFVEFKSASEDCTAG